MAMLVITRGYQFCCQSKNKPFTKPVKALSGTQKHRALKTCLVCINKPHLGHLARGSWKHLEAMGHHDPRDPMEGTRTFARFGMGLAH